jgi:hypothetical protein
VADDWRHQELVVDALFVRLAFEALCIFVVLLDDGKGSRCGCTIWKLTRGYSLGWQVDDPGVLVTETATARDFIVLLWVPV